MKKIKASIILALILAGAACNFDSWELELEEIYSGFYVEQGSGQCGPTSFYMIFRYFGHHKKNGHFTELPDCGEELYLQEELTEVTEESLVSQWLGVTNSGINTGDLFEKVENLGTESCTPFYHADGSPLHEDYENAEMFNYIYHTFLKHFRPVIIHLYRGLLYSGHYIVAVAYNEKSKTVYYVDPNRNEAGPLIDRVSLNSFLNESWYLYPDESQQGLIPPASWDGQWVGFFRN